MEELSKIKKLLPNMVSSDLVLLVEMTVRQLRVTCVKEAHSMFRIATDPKTMEYLKEVIKK